MIKADIVNEIAEKTNLPRGDASVIVEQIIKIIKETLVKGDRLELRDFGVFQVKNRVSRVGRNPRTKVAAKIPARKIPSFKPGRELKELVNT